MERCSSCGIRRRRPGQRWCAPCHAAYMRRWRRSNPPTEDQRRRDRARSYAGVYLRRGKLKRSPCERCGAPAQMHHDDYAKPLEVRWLCRPCHLREHRARDGAAGPIHASRRPR